MSKYSKTSSQRLASCHPDLQLIFNEAIKFVDCSIFCGHRKEKEQNEAFFNDFSKLAWPESKHNRFPSMAVDAGPYFTDLKNTDWADHLAFACFAGVVKVIAVQLLKQGLITHRVRWGGDFNNNGRSADESFLDLPHFELIPA
jgi:peptidoglycan L-alanyl-D-glutamate endopeptidase CwlK